MKIAAIGDIHGCATELFELLNRLYDWFGDEGGKLVFLGDYVDRGPDSKIVLDTLMNWDRPEIEPIFIMGNHEQLMIHAIIYNNVMANNVWLGNGGKQTIESIGEDNFEPYCRWLLRNCSLYHEEPGLLFVHAGIDPNRDIEDQFRDDWHSNPLMWIRGPFLDSTKDFGRIVVHGHTPVDRVDIRSNRINLDTACCYGEKLSAGLFRNGALERVISIPRAAPAQ